MQTVEIRNTHVRLIYGPLNPDPKAGRKSHVLKPGINQVSAEYWDYLMLSTDACCRNFRRSIASNGIVKGPVVQPSQAQPQPQPQAVTVVHNNHPPQAQPPQAQPPQAPWEQLENLSTFTAIRAATLLPMVEDKSLLVKWATAELRLGVKKSLTDRIAELA